MEPTPSIQKPTRGSGSSSFLVTLCHATLRDRAASMPVLLQLGHPRDNESRGAPRKSPLLQAQQAGRSQAAGVAAAARELSAQPCTARQLGDQP